MKCLHCKIVSPLHEWIDLPVVFNDSGLIHGPVDWESIDAGLKEPLPTINSERGYQCPHCGHGQPNFTNPLDEE